MGERWGRREGLGAEVGAGEGGWRGGRGEPRLQSLESWLLRRHISGEVIGMSSHLVAADAEGSRLVRVRSYQVFSSSFPRANAGVH